MENNNKGCTLHFGGWFVGALTLMFIAFKLLGIIDWNWIWVLSPIWISWILSIIIIVILFILYIWAHGNNY